jgi:hypothetical protein
VAIGTDDIYRYYSEDTLREHNEKLIASLAPDLRDQFHFRTPANPPALNTSTKDMVIRRMLLNADMAQSTVDKVMSGNAVRFISDNLPTEVA